MNRGAAGDDAQTPADAGGDVARHLEYLRVERRLAPRTLAMYAEALARLERIAAEAALPLREVQTQHLRRYAAQMHGGGLGPRSIAIAISAWRGFYRRLGQEGWVAANPADGVRAPKAAKPLPKALSVDDAVALVEHRREGGSAALEARDRCIAELLYGSGLRVGELAGLDVSASTEASGWVDAADASAHVLGKGSKRRSVPVGAPALRALETWLAHRGEMARDDEPALFVSSRGTRLTPSQVRSRLRARGAAAGLAAPVHPHMLRHSYASHLLQSSGDLRGVQELLGHANITTTQIYTRLDFGHLSKVYDAAHPRAKKRTP